jgi:hypothetical protein
MTDQTERVTGPQQGGPRTGSVLVVALLIVLGVLILYLSGMVGILALFAIPLVVIAVAGWLLWRLVGR